MVSSDNEGSESLCFIMIYSVVKLLNTGRTPVTTSLIDFHLGMIVAFITIHYHVASVCVPFGFCIVPPRRGSHRKPDLFYYLVSTFLTAKSRSSWKQKQKGGQKKTHKPLLNTHTHTGVTMQRQRSSLFSTWGTKNWVWAADYSKQPHRTVSTWILMSLLYNTHTHAQRKTNLSTENTFSLTQSSRPLVHINRLFSASTDDSACRRMQSGSEGTRGV